MARVAPDPALSSAAPTFETPNPDVTPSQRPSGSLRSGCPSFWAAGLTGTRRVQWLQGPSREG